MFHRTGHKRLHRPVVGDLDLTYEAFDLPADPGLRMLVYTAEPATPTADALTMLASWAPWTGRSVSQLPTSGRAMTAARTTLTRRSSVIAPRQGRR